MFHTLRRMEKKGQTAMELAVFGAILIFIIGAIVRQALSAGTLQNQQFRALRQAMSLSYRHSGGLVEGMEGYEWEGNASHRTASIMFIEDRLTADSGKYGATERSPYVVGATATYSRNLFLPIDVGEDYNLPVYDMIINGKHFPFTTARFKNVYLAKSCKNDASCPTQCKGQCTNDSLQFSPLFLLNNPRDAQFCSSDCNGIFCRNVGDCGLGSLKTFPATDLTSVTDISGGESVDSWAWENNCVDVTVTLSSCTEDDCDAACPDKVNDCTVSPGPAITQTQMVGCAKLYDIVYNGPGFVDWCTGVAGGSACPANNLSADERFDLDRSGATDVLAPPIVSEDVRNNFSWQWFLVAGKNGTWHKHKAPWGVTQNLLIGEAIVLEPSSCKKNCRTPKHISIDVDGDLKLETIMTDTMRYDKITGIITQFVVMDMQDGDMDFSRSDHEGGRSLGLQKEMKMLTQIKDGTYLQIDQGRLYNPADTRQYIRTAQEKDQVDTIERIINISNDTDRFCDSNGQRNVDLKTWPPGMVNPVEACNDCHGMNGGVTCMEEDDDFDTPGKQPAIYVRSRIVDRHGRKWITSTSGDDYVDFTIPK